MTVLRSKVNALCKVFHKLEQNAQFFQYLAGLVQSDSAKTREFAMYGYEIMSEINLTGQELTAAKDDFIQIFDKTLQDSEVNVKIAALKAVASFISGLEDLDTVQAFVPVLPKLLNLVEEALNANEEKGRQALESMCELTTSHAEVWKNLQVQLI